MAERVDEARSTAVSSNAKLETDPTATGTIEDDDAAMPTISAVAVTSTPVLETDTYGAGETIEVSVTFSEAVNATSGTDFVLSVAGARRAPLLRGSDTATLVFGYTVVSSDDDDNGIWIGDQDRTLVGNRNGEPQNGTITSVATSAAADLTHDELGTGLRPQGGRLADERLGGGELDPDPSDSTPTGRGRRSASRRTSDVPVDVSGGSGSGGLAMRTTRASCGTSTRITRRAAARQTLVFSIEATSGALDLRRQQPQLTEGRGRLPARTTPTARCDVDSDDQRSQGTRDHAPTTQTIYWQGRVTQTWPQGGGARGQAGQQRRRCSAGSASLSLEENTDFATVVGAVDNDAVRRHYGLRRSPAAPDQLLFSEGLVRGGAELQRCAVHRGPEVIREPIGEHLLRRARCGRPTPTGTRRLVGLGQRHDGSRRRS